MYAYSVCIQSKYLTHLQDMNLLYLYSFCLLKSDDPSM